MKLETPPVCSYEGSDYQTSFWEQGGRAYEDQVEAIAIKRLLPQSGELLLEIGAGAGRNTLRYRGFKRVVLLDYSLTQLQQAQGRLGRGDRFLYVAANAYRLPFRPGLFDAATMIRTLHHMAEPRQALSQARSILQPGGIFLLEYANKQNLKSILRYLLHRQSWSPFSKEPVEFAALNYDFHPAAVRAWLQECGFTIERQLTVSHYRIQILKRLIPTRILVLLDSIAQLTGNWWQLTPSVFLRAQATVSGSSEPAQGMFRCPSCGGDSLQEKENRLACTSCGREWLIRDGIYDFRI